MKILRHILSHLFLIFFLLAIASVFYYRTLLLPTDIVEKVDGIVTEVYPPALSFVSKRNYFWSIGGERIVSFDDLTIFEKDNELASNSKVEDITEVELSEKVGSKPIDIAKKEVESGSQVQKEETITVAKIADTETTKISAVKPAIKKEEVAAAEPVQKVIVEPEVVKEPIAELPKKSNKTEELPVAVKDSDTSSERDLLINARNAFNQGNINRSEKIYIELTQLDNDNPDIFGELGNVYYSQGKWDKAGKAYYEAAVRLIAEGNFNQVDYLQRVISGLSTEHAEKLSQLMMRR